MATRSHIAYRNSNGEFEFRYHHFDGYISYLGEFINKELNNEDLIKKVFEVNKSIVATTSIERHLKEEKESLRDDKDNKYSYINGLKDTDNRHIGNLFIKFFKITDDTLGKCKSRKELLNKCNEEYIYLYENKKWKVKADFSEYFIDLSFAVKVNDFLEGILEIIREEREKGKSYAIDKILDFNQQKINKSYDFMTIKRTPKQDIFMKEMLNSKEDKEFNDLVEVLAQTKTIMLLKGKIEKDLPEKIAKKSIRNNKI